jgi:hexosaminidase
MTECGYLAQSLRRVVAIMTLASTTALYAGEASHAEVNAEYADLRVGDLHLYYAPGPGGSLQAFDIPVLNTSLIAVVTPGWGSQYYVTEHNVTLLRDARVEEVDGGKRLVIRHELDNEIASPFTATETHALLPENVYRVTLDFEFASDDPAVLEWRVGGMNPNLAAGVPFVASYPDHEIACQIPYEAPGPGVEESTVARRFDKLLLQSPIGDIIIESNARDDLVLLDYRKNQYAMDSNPMFWFGYLERPIPAREKLHYEFTMRLPEKLSAEAINAGALKVESAISDAEVVRIPTTKRDYIIPKPKELAYLDEHVPLKDPVTIYVGPDAGAGIMTAAEFLARDLEDIYELRSQVIADELPTSIPSGAILLGELGRWSLPQELIAKDGLVIPDHREGYALSAGNGHVAIAANTEQGVFYGVTTLVQLISFGEGAIGVRGARIVDYPSLDFRGIHALSGRHAGGQISKAVRELLARYKLNSFIWESQYIVWDSCPELEHPEFGMAKDDARLVVDAASRYFVDLIPLIQSLGHSEWIFTNGHNLDIAEDPDMPYAYSPTNPRTYDFIFSVYQEALDFFQPKGFHIGHDEVTMRGRFPYRSRESGMSATDLILMDTIKLNDWFRERGVKVHLWGDMFLHTSEAADATFAPSPEEAAERRARLPKDMTIVDWHYKPVTPAEYTSIPLWRLQGFDVIGAGWYTPANIHQLALACIEAGAKGYLQTTWAGFNFAIDDNEASWYQYWTYILAAHYAWSGDEREPADLPFNAKDEFIRTWFRTKPLLTEKRGAFLDLTAAFNRAVVDPDGSEWLGYGPLNDFRSLPEGTRRMGSTVFHLPDTANGKRAVHLHGRMNAPGEYPESAELQLDGLVASGLHFLVTTNFPTREHAVVGQVVVNYADGTHAELALEYGRNIFAVTESRAGATTPIAWEGQSAAGTALRLWDLGWENPAPEKPIDSIRLQSAGTEAAPILFAVTAVY